MTPSPPPPGWLGAVRQATRAPDATEGLTRMLAAAVPDVGAVAGAVVETETGACRAVWGCSAPDLRPLLDVDGPVYEALGRAEEWIDGVIELPPGAAILPAAADRALLAPLCTRDLATGALILFFGGAAPAAAAGAATTLASVAALVLENERLFHEAREALQAREHFLTALNHELRTPATALMLNAELLRTADAGGLPPRVARALHETETHVRAMMDVLRRVIDLGQLGDQAASERTDVLHPRQTVAELMRRVEPLARRKGLELALYVPRGLPPLQTDVGRFTRILLHLLSNAIKYTAQGTVEVRLERAQRALGRHRQEPVLVVRVADTGHGIPPGEVRRVFEPFAQVVEGARGDSHIRGSGLGLPLARLLARSLGGDLSLESTPGRGTVASLVLPYRVHTP